MSPCAGLREGRGPRHLQGQLGNRTSDDHGEIWLGTLQLRGAHQHAPSFWQDLQVPNTHDSLLVIGWYHPRPVLLVRSIAIFCACLAMSFGIEIVVFSPARRASRKLLERIVEFIRLAGGDAKICECTRRTRTTLRQPRTDDTHRYRAQTTKKRAD